MYYHLNNQYSISSGGSRTRTYEGISQQIYSLPQLTALVSPQARADGEIRTHGLLITNQLL